MLYVCWGGGALLEGQPYWRTFQWDFIINNVVLCKVQGDILSFSWSCCQFFCSSCNDFMKPRDRCDGWWHSVWNEDKTCEWSMIGKTSSNSNIVIVLFYIFILFHFLYIMFWTGFFIKDNIVVLLLKDVYFFIFNILAYIA